ncbi:unnamed protein product [Sphenostylis stenocarpa]|uniref:Uncharacterized protein n=1 Tax=Sphenostylis stenocarpa TaxID=92480 RepID=A0AA86V7G7_9FABA|nr:unnamed protein product [Sphenostylis stenocarpa]
MLQNLLSSFAKLEWFRKCRVSEGGTSTSKGLTKFYADKREPCVFLRKVLTITTSLGCFGSSKVFFSVFWLLDLVGTSLSFFLHQKSLRFMHFVEFVKVAE